MENNKPFLSVIMPALNEEENIASAISRTLEAFQSFGISGEIIVVNDGSTDNTGKIIEKEARKAPSLIKPVAHVKSQGIGASFWAGVDLAAGSIVCMLPGDNENDAGEIIRYLPYLKETDIVIPFVAKGRKRSLFRSILSWLFRMVIRCTFAIPLRYTNGTVLYKKEKLLGAVARREKGFFFQTDILVRMMRKKIPFKEVPYALNKRVSGSSKAISFVSLYGVMKGYLCLVRDIYFRARV